VYLAIQVGQLRREIESKAVLVEKASGGFHSLPMSLRMLGGRLAKENEQMSSSSSATCV
jgi:hypothetical protein